MTGPEPTKVGTFKGKHPLNAGDLRRVVANLNVGQYTDAALVEIETPLPPHDRRIVNLTVRDYENTEGNQR